MADPEVKQSDRVPAPAIESCAFCGKKEGDYGAELLLRSQCRKDVLCCVECVGTHVVLLLRWASKEAKSKAAEKAKAATQAPNPVERPYTRPEPEEVPLDTGPSA